MKITTCMYSVLLLLLCLPPVYTLRGLQNDYPILACEIRVAHFMQEETLTPDKDLEEDQVSCVVDGIIYNIPREILDEYDSELKAPGPKKMLIAGGSLPKARYTGNGHVPEIVCPQDASVIIISDDRRRRRNLEEGAGRQRQQGVSNLLVMRVIANDVSTTMSSELLHERIFGDGSNVENSDGGDSSTLRQTYLDCSNGNLSFEPATGYDIENGVGFVEIDMTVRGASNRVVENKVTEAINAKYGSVDDWDHIIYCLPKGTDKAWVAFGYEDWYRSVYNDEWCGQNSALAHEVGHNIGLMHSNEGRKYGDQTCMVGYSYDWVGGPRMCFNAHKNWLTGWYSDKAIEIQPDAAPWRGTLVGSVDYDMANDNEYIVIRFMDVYMQYNRKKTFNRQVREKPNELVIVQAEAADKPSELLIGLKEGDAFDYQGYTIKVCDVGAGPGQDSIQVSIYLSSESDLCVLSTEPQPAPSFAPTLGTTTPPTPAPVIPITLTPTEVPSTLMPTARPSAPPTSSPTTRVPTPAPSPSPVTLSPITLTIDDSCDDTAGVFFVSFLPGYERCVWLKARPEYAQLLCEEGHESGARDVCPETCGACTDTCVDDMRADVVIDGVNRDCPWLDLRPEEVEKECKVGTDAWNYCRETCGNCNPFPTASPSATPSTSNPTVTPLPTEKNPHDACDDDRFATFYVNETDKPEPCRWLWTRPAMREVYCDPSHSAGAYDLCEETCKKCSDDCVDDPIKMVDINSVDRSCTYISMRNALIEEYCVEGEEAYMYCRETCNSCLPPTDA